ncbi:MAG: efflux RND transporter periplasmic adaptor subunit [Deltaproteobacteria bacterium]|nr:efflux RND transporter periplasmic adaptor subunit [Deltaproteobacteria bacterium]
MKSKSPDDKPSPQEPARPRTPWKIPLEGIKNRVGALKARVGGHPSLVLGLGLAVGLTVGLGGGYLMSGQGGGGSSPAGERKPLYYRSPMDPSITSPDPGKDAMGMDFVPVYADEAAATSGEEGFRIDPVMVQNIGVRTAKAEFRTLSHTTHAVGRVDTNEENLTRLHPKTEGWIDKLLVDKTGQPVKKDQVLLSIYSPQLVSSQEEYLLALRNLKVLGKNTFPDISKGAKDMVRTSRERLEWLDVPPHQIQELERTGVIRKTLHIHSPIHGIVMAVGAREGQFVSPMTQLYMLADLSKVWVYADIYENDMGWVHKGDMAEIKLAALPGRVFKGSIAYIYPYLEPNSRTVKVRVEVNNADLALKPDMFADVVIRAAHPVTALVIPAEAVVRTGSQKRVFVVRGSGKFDPRVVELGVASDKMVQVLSGVKEGEEVVTSSQFLIDSESNLRESVRKMEEAGSAAKVEASGASRKTEPSGAAPASPSSAAHSAPAMAPDMPGMDMPPDPKSVKPGNPVKPPAGLKSGRRPETKAVPTVPAPSAPGPGGGHSQDMEGKGHDMEGMYD